MRLIKRYKVLGLIACIGFVLAACGDDDSSKTNDGRGTPGEVDLSAPVRVNIDEDVPRWLSGFNLFSWSQEDGFIFHDDVVPYDLNTPLFSDYALKSRGIYVPEGTSIQYDDNDILEFPEGTLILKTFYFSDDIRVPDEDNRLIETRILILEKTGWKAYPYIWNEEQTDAYLDVTGQNFEVELVDLQGKTRHASYRVPSRNDCQQCHIRKDDETSKHEAFLPIGPKARHLNRDYAYVDGTKNQLEYMEARGILSGLPAIDEVDKAFDFSIVENDGVDSLVGDTETLNKAAVDYLDVNCAHCHSPTGVQGVSSQLFLNHDYDESELKSGICKQPGSSGPTGGNKYDIVPGSADESILYYRIHTEVPGSMMPILARSLEHTDGTELVKAWIDNMPTNDKCPPSESDD